MNTLIFCKKTIFQKLYFWMKIYVSKSNLISRLNRVNIINEDILNAAEYRLMDYNSSLIKESLIDKLLDRKTINCFKDLYTLKEYRDIFGKKLMYEIKNIILSFKYAEAGAKKNNITGTIYIWPLNFDYTVYRNLKLSNHLPENIKIVRFSILINILRNILINIYIFIKSFSILEKNIFNSNYKNPIKKEYKYIMHMDEGLKLWGLNKNDFMIDNNVINKNEVLFINSEENNPSWVKEYRADNFNVLNIYQVPLSVNKKIIIKLYKKYIKLRLGILYMVFSKSWVVQELFYILKENIYWEAFYYKYKINQSISFMTARSIPESLMHARMNTKTTFIYFSITENILDNILDPEVSQCHEYTHMYYDSLITNKISAKWLKTLQIRINEDILIGPILSEKIINTRSTKYTLVNKYKLDNYRCIVAYIDTPAGLYAESDINSYKNFIKSLLILSESNQEICYLLKTKKPLVSINNLYDKDLNELLKKVLNRDNIMYVNDLDISIYQAIGLADFVITGRKSSAAYEALHARQPVICYDTTKRKNQNLLYHYIDKCNAYNHEELIKLHNYWIKNYNTNGLDKYFSRVDKILEMESYSTHNIKTLRDCIAS